MKNRLTTDEKKSIVSRLTDRHLYNLLHTFCPGFERRLDTVRPSTEEILVEAVAVIDNIINMPQEDVSMYCDGLWDSIYNEWRDATEDRGDKPSEKDLYSTTSLILFAVLTFMNACSTPNSLNCAASIATNGDRLCRDQFEEVQNAFMKFLPKALDNGFQQWVIDYAAGPGGLFVDEQPQPAMLSTIALKSGRKKEEGRGNKANLCRVIMALHKSEFFVRKDGKELDVQDVFNSFGAMLGEDFSTYADLLKIDNDHNLDGVSIFTHLNDKYSEYIKEKEARKKARQ